MHLPALSSSLLLLSAAPAASRSANLTAEQLGWVRTVARGNDPAAWPPMSAAQAAAVGDAAKSWWTNFHDHHLAFNASVEATYTDRSRSTLIGYGDAGDSALWTGSFLAAAVHRYNFTQEPEVLERIKTTVGVYENLTRVSGKLGFMGRFMGLTTDAAYQRDFNSSGCAHGSNRERAKKQCWSFVGAPPFEDWTYEDHVSRDAYFGAALGLGTTFALVTDAETRLRAQTVLKLMVADLHQSGWWIESPHYEAQFGLGDPTAGLIAVWQRIGLSVDPERWAPVFGHDAPKVHGGCKLGSWLDFKTNCTYAEAVHLAQTGDPETACCIGDFRIPGLKQGRWETMYFPANLGINMLYTTLLLETEPTMKAQLMTSLEEWMELGKTHLQGSFAAFYLAAHVHKQGGPDRIGGPGAVRRSDAPLTRVAKGTLQALLIDMASMGSDWKWSRASNVTADSRTLPHREGVCSKKTCDTVAEYALLPSLRPVAEYYWQRCPTSLAGGSDEVAHELPPIDGILAYWVGKYAGAV